MNRGNVKYSFNNADVIGTGTVTVGGISGAAGGSRYPTAYIYNCYNIGTVTGNRNTREITGWTNANGGTSIERNCYTANVTTQLLNSGEFSDNCWMNDEKNGNGEWKYNNGYPILKWQVTKR